MKIILNKDVQNLGEEGDIREVARGYARNYLIPQGFGVAYTKQNLALLEGKRKAIEKRKGEKRDQAKGLKERIEGLDMTIPMTVGETGRLFGSVTNAMIAEELSKLGVEIERKKIEIAEHTIKSVGNFVVKVKLYGNEVASLKVAVTGPKGKTPAEAPKEEAASEAAATSEETSEPEAAAEEAVSDTEATEPETAVEETTESDSDGEVAEEASEAPAEPTEAAEEEDPEESPEKE